MRMERPGKPQSGSELCGVVQAQVTPWPSELPITAWFREEHVIEAVGLQPQEEHDLERRAPVPEAVG